MLLANCVKEQYYQEEEENASKQTHIHVQEETRTQMYTAGLDRE